MFNWTRKSLLFFHPDKYFTMNVRSKSKPQCSHIYSISSKTLEVNSELKDLSVLIDDNLKFSHHILEKVNKANQIMGLIRRSFTYMNQHNFILLFKSLVRPHLEYVNVTWSPILKKDIQLIENIERRATRVITVINHLSYQEHLEKLD